ncbi:hypothetical protein AALA00_11445 [Lachnospiraceae bacterium 46-15]
MKKGMVFVYGILMLLLAGCAQDSAAEVSGKQEGEFRVYQTFCMAVDTGDGFYYSDDTGFLKYFDYQAKKESLVCNKPNCRHESWYETTPPEERCDAYVWTSRGFVTGGKLYLLEEGLLEDGTRGKLRIVESDLDRTGQREIQTLDGGMLTDFAVKDKILYAAVGQSEMIEMEGGGWQNSSKCQNKLYRIDLVEGAAEVLVEKEGFNSDIGIIAADGNKLYLEFSYFEKEFDGTNFEEAKFHQEYYAYSLETKRMTGILQGKSLLPGTGTAMANGKFYGCMESQKEAAEEQNVSDLKKIDLDTGEEELIAHAKNLHMMEGYALYEKIGETGGFVYDFGQEKEIAAPAMKLDNLYPYCQAGDYLYTALYDEKSQEYPIGFIALDRLAEGEERLFIVAN